MRGEGSQFRIGEADLFNDSEVRGEESIFIWLFGRKQWKWSIKSRRAKINPIFKNPQMTKADLL